MRSIDELRAEWETCDSEQAHTFYAGMTDAERAAVEAFADGRHPHTEETLLRWMDCRRMTLGIAAQRARERAG